jgi:hypothetical protein
MNKKNRTPTTPTIKKINGGWMFYNHDTLLISNSKSDKEYMIRKVKEWKKNEQVR